MRFRFAYSEKAWSDLIQIRPRSAPIDAAAVVDGGAIQLRSVFGGTLVHTTRGRLFSRVHTSIPEHNVKGEHNISHLGSVGIGA